MIGVECRFLNDGRVEVQRIQIDGRWLTVEQGRQWLDRGGRHVLIMAPGMAAQELNLRPGKYVAVGNRAGYRDVRIEFRVAPEDDMQPIVVQCEEQI